MMIYFALLCFHCVVLVSGRLLMFDSFDYDNSQNLNGGVGFAGAWQSESGYSQIATQDSSDSSSWNGQLSDLNATVGRLACLSNKTTLYRALGTAVRSEIVSSGLLWMSVLVRSTATVWHRAGSRSH
jgi:hypothetical protein